MKEYLMLIHENLDTYAETTPEEMQADIERHVKWVEGLVKQGHFKSGNPLNPESAFINNSKGLITDGPYAETKEGVSGYYFLLASSLEEATQIARGCPSFSMGATLEIREVIQTGG
jgi:hypothetical protein